MLMVCLKQSKNSLTYVMLHHDKISRVTLWGVGDKDSWRNNWPMRGRTDYPLLFDRNYEAKPVVKQLMELALAEKKAK
jgi:endo-1,4-beta-xylanase